MMFNNISNNLGGRGFGGGFRGMGCPGHGPRGPMGPRGRGPRGAGGPGGRFRSKVREGIQNGTISREEASALRSGKQNMSQLMQNAQADGQITSEERQQLRAHGQQLRQMMSSFSQG